MTAWNARGRLTVDYATLVAGLLYAGTCYVAASLAFPDESSEWETLDDYYDAQRRLAVGAIAALNLLIALLLTNGRLWAPPWHALMLQISYFAASALIVSTARRGINAVALTTLIAIYVAGTVLEWAQS